MVIPKNGYCCQAFFGFIRCSSFAVAHLTNSLTIIVALQTLPCCNSKRYLLRQIVLQSLGNPGMYCPAHPLLVLLNSVRVL